MKRLALFLLLAAPGAALAYPHFQLSADSTTCKHCHYAPAGGGLLNDWGREASGSVVSGGGDGGFLHGALTLPTWLSVGGDVRLAALVNKVGKPQGAQVSVFPMQVDLAVRVGPENLWGVAAVGLRGAARAPEGQAMEITFPALAERLISREHYVYWAPGGGPYYARVGRFFAPYGLRLVDHTAYVRRHLGYNLFEETYGLSGGMVKEEWEVHATAFVSDLWRTPAREERGAAALFEMRAGPALWGASARLSFGAHDRRAIMGAHAKRWWKETDLLLMAELDGAWQAFDALRDADRVQLFGYAGAAWTPLVGLWVGAAYELFDEDLAVRDVARNALGIWLSWLPWAHLEAMLSARLQRLSPGNLAAAALFQLHYYP